MEELFLQVLNMSYIGAIVILFILIIRIPLKKDYSKSLLLLATGRKKIRAIPLKNIINYRKPMFWIAIVTSLLIVLLAVGLVANPEKLILPNTNDVLSIEMEQINKSSSIGPITFSENESIEKVLGALNGARKTIGYSTNDYPSQNNYLVVRLNLENEQRTLCLYSDNGNYYIEELYIGIYKSDKETSSALNKVFKGNAFAGIYAFEECVYMTPFSSYYPFEGTGEYYVIEGNRLTRINEKTGEVLESISYIEWNEQSFSDNEWKEMFEYDLHMPDINHIDYNSRAMYVLSNRYRLLDMDGDIWLVKMVKDKIWSIYRLKTRVEEFEEKDKLSNMSNEECVEFIKSKGVEIPEDYTQDVLETFVKDTIIRVEENPDMPFVYDYTVTLQFAEEIRDVVNAYYGVESNTIQNKS